MKFRSESGCLFTIKVRLKKNNQSPVENFASKSGENILSEVRLKNENQSLIDPETIFKRDRDRDEKFSSRGHGVG